MSDQGCAAERSRPETRTAKAWKQIKWRLYLLSLRLFYQRFSRTIHYFGMHQMKRICALGGKPFYRCEWCGMHGTKVEVTSSLNDPVSSPSHPGEQK